MRTDTPLRAEPALRKICPAAATLPLRDPPRCDGPPFAGSAPPLRRSVFCRICPAAAIHLPQKQKSERFCGAAEVAEIRQGGDNMQRHSAMGHECGTGAEKLEKRRSGRACSLDTKRVRSGNWSNIQSIAFSFALLSKRNGFALGLRIFTFWLVRLQRYLPHDLFSLSTT